MDLVVTILAGGLGKRMQSQLPKVLHVVRGEPMLIRIVKQVLILEPKQILMVVGKFKDIIQQTVSQWLPETKIIYVDQPEPLGSAHAITVTLPYLPATGCNLILNGDVPLLTAQTLQEVLAAYQPGLLITGIELPDPTGNGRLLTVNDELVAIREEKDCYETERAIQLVNVGIYLAEVSILQEYIPQISNHNAQNEFYITDLVSITPFRKQLYILPAAKQIEIFNVNTKQQLAYINSI